MHHAHPFERGSAIKLTNEQITQLHECFGALNDNLLSDAQAEWLNSLLNESEAARILYVRNTRLCTHLHWDFGTVPGDADYPKEHLIAREPPNPKLLKTTASKHSRQRKGGTSQASQKWIAALWAVVPLLAILLIGGGFFLSYLVSDDEKMVVRNDPLQIGKKRKLTEGKRELTFPTGSKIALTAPATFIVTGENSIRLLQGKLIGNVPPSGIGFQVDTPRGRVVDLGTIFSVYATTDLNTEVQVFRGKVVASLVDHLGVVQSSKTIQANQAMKIDFLKKEVADVPYASNDFTASIQEKYGIVKHSKTVVFQEQMPEAVAAGEYNSFEHDNLAFLFPEKRNVLLKENLDVEIGQPGVYQSSTDLVKGKSTIPAGSTVDCFRVYYKPAIYSDIAVKVQGEILFDRPILGVIIIYQELAKTNRLFHPAFKSVLDKNTLASPGLEIGTDKDGLTISQDRKTLTFKLGTGGKATDEFRVILESRKDRPL